MTEWAKKKYNDTYTEYMPWIEDKVLGYWGENKTSYTAKGTHHLSLPFPPFNFSSSSTLSQFRPLNNPHTPIPIPIPNPFTLTNSSSFLCARETQHGPHRRQKRAGDPRWHRRRRRRAAVQRRPFGRRGRHDEQGGRQQGRERGPGARPQGAGEAECAEEAREGVDGDVVVGVFGGE